MFFNVFAQTTHVVAAPHGFACVGIPATRLYIPSFIEIRSRFRNPRGVKIWPFSLLWLVAFTTACTTVQAVIVIWQLSFILIDLDMRNQHYGCCRWISPYIIASNFVFKFAVPHMLCACIVCAMVILGSRNSNRRWGGTVLWVCEEACTSDFQNFEYWQVRKFETVLHLILLIYYCYNNASAMW